MLFSHSFLPWFLSLDFQEPLTFFQHLLLTFVAAAVAAAVAVAVLVVAVLVVDLAVADFVVDLVAADLAVIDLVPDLVDFVVAAGFVAVLVESFSSEHIPNYIWNLHHQDLF